MLHAWVADAKQSLNELAGHNAANSNQSGLLGVALMAEKCVLEAVHDVGRPPDGLTRLGAFEALQSNHSYTGESVTVAPMDVDLLSVPTVSVPQELGALVEDA